MLHEGIRSNRFDHGRIAVLNISLEFFAGVTLGVEFPLQITIILFVRCSDSIVILVVYLVFIFDTPAPIGVVNPSRTFNCVLVLICVSVIKIPPPALCLSRQRVTSGYRTFPFLHIA